MPTVMSCIREVDRTHLLQWLQSSTSMASRIKGIVDGKVIIIVSNVRAIILHNNILLCKGVRPLYCHMMVFVINYRYTV